MSLANLTINITANSGQAQSSLRTVSEVAKSTMNSSADSVEQFRAGMVDAGAKTERASQQIGAGMRAANDVIVTTSAQSEAALQKLSDTAENVDMRGYGEKIAAAVGVGIGTGYAVAQTWIQKVEDYVKTKAKYIAIGLAIAAVSATAGVVYGAYRIISGTLGFVSGLFNGESYKSASIDQLIALNDQVKALQGNLHVSAQEAGALLDATGRLGVDKADYSSAYKSAESAMRTNGDELDRLGVKYKDQNGRLLSQREFLTNVKTALDAYSAGWDRNQAAAAIGAGGAEQINQALKVTQAELDKSKARLDLFGVSIGPKTQEAVAQYEQAMREFNNETKLMGQGFSRVWADNIMPVLTDLADFMREGWPSAVQLFRVGFSTLTGLFYAFKNGVYIVAESILGSIESIGLGIGGLGLAFAKALTGDFSGAKNALLGGLEDAQKRFMQIGTNIVAQVMHNDAAIKLATGADGRSDSLDASKDKAHGKPWTPKPAADAADTAAKSSAYQTYLDELDRMIAKVGENEFASMRLRAAQLAEKEGITDLTDAMQKINQVQSGESAKVVAEHLRKLDEQTKAYSEHTTMLGMGTLAREQYAEANKLWLETENAIAAAQKSGKPLTDEAITQLRAQTAATDDLMAAEIRRRYTEGRSESTGIKKALRDYQESAGNAAKNAETLITGSMQKIEDAFVNFAKTGKMSFKDVFSFMAEEFLRQQLRMVMAEGISASKGVSVGSVFSAIGSIFGFGGATKLAGGMDYVPYDGFPAILHKGERVQTAVQARNGGGSDGGAVFDYSGQTINVGQGVSRGEVHAAVQQANAASEMRIRRLLRNGNI